MKAQTTDRLYLQKIIAGFTGMFFIFIFAPNQFAYGAGSSSQ